MVKKRGAEMLTLNIKEGLEENDYIMIGDDIKIMLKVIKTKAGPTYSIAIDAPKNIPIYRKRVYEEMKEAEAAKGAEAAS